MATGDGSETGEVRMPDDLTVAQRVVVRRALAVAVRLCRDVVALSDDALGALVERIMGARPTPSRLAGIRRDYQRIGDHLAAMTPDQFRNQPGGAYYAEVDPDDATAITLGDDFWDADRRGIDTTAGTLVHEASHFLVVRGTDDHAYGDEIEELGLTLARNNADTLERVAEEAAQ